MNDDPLQLIGLLLTIVAGTVASIVATAAETALLTCHALRRRLPQSGPEGELVDTLFARQDRLILSLRGFNLGAKLCAAVAAAVLGSQLIQVVPALRGYPAIGYAAGGVLALLATIILAEIVPKSLPEDSASTIALFLAPFAWIILKVMAPLVWAHVAMARWIAAAPDDDSQVDSDISEVELRTMLSLGEIDGVIEEDTRDIIEGIFSFGDQVAGEIMTPREEVFSLSADELESDASVVVAALRSSAYTRALIHRDSLDHIVGILDRKNVLLNPGEPIASFVHKPLFVPESRNLANLLADMKRSRIHFAVILDEFGGTAGIVTMEDLLNEIVGELEDDATRGAEIRTESETSWLVSGRLEVEDLNDRLDFSLPDETAHTVSGLMLSALDRLPDVDDRVDIGDTRLTVTRMGARRVAQARIERLGAAPNGNGNSAGDAHEFPADESEATAIASDGAARA